VKNSSTQVQWLGSTPSYNGNQQLESYDTVVYAGQNPPLSESFDLTYDALNRVSTVTRDSDNQVVTYSYDASTGRPSSVNLSDEGTFSFSYLSNGKLESVTYPGQQGTEDYSYDSEGRLQSIELPDSSVLSFSRNSRKDLASAQFTDTQNTVYRYDFTYDDQANLISSLYSIDGLQMESWSYYWGPQGLEYASRSGGQAITQNFSTDPSGRILSMTYGSASYSGELYYHYDALGNTTLLTDAGGNPKASFIYDLHTGKMIDSWNPDNLVIINLEQGISGNLGYELPEGIKVLVPPWKYRLLTPFELYLFFQNIRYPDEEGMLMPRDPTSPAFFDESEISISGGMLLSWWNMWLVADGLSHNTAQANVFSIQIYLPDTMYMHGGGGGGTQRSKINFDNCMANCFSHDRGKDNKGNINTPSSTRKTRWNDWNTAKSLEKKYYRNLQFFIAVAIITIILVVGASFATAGTATAVLAGAAFTSFFFTFSEYKQFRISLDELSDFVNKAGLWEAGQDLFGSLATKHNLEASCLGICAKYNPA